MKIPETTICSKECLDSFANYENYNGKFFLHYIILVWFISFSIFLNYNSIFCANFETR
jgi:hypothetical protein